jgi:hypothetical protein
MIIRRHSKQMKLRELLIQYSAGPDDSLPIDQQLLEQEGLGDENKRDALLRALDASFSGDLSREIFGTESPGTQTKGTCGYSFKSSDLIYRCVDCGVDESCCLCSLCFHETDHEGHDIQIHPCRNSGGMTYHLLLGCCDCGSKDAFKNPLKCKNHHDPNSSNVENCDTPNIPEGLLESMKRTISIVLDFILEQIDEHISLEKAIPFQSIHYGALKPPQVFDAANILGPYQILLWKTPISTRRIIERIIIAFPEGIEVKPVLVEMSKKCV